jgi:ATP-grasp domain
MTSLVVVYDEGSARVGEIAGGLSALGEVIFAVPRGAADAGLLTLMGDLGQAVVLEGSPSADLRSLAACSPAAILTFSERMLTYTAVLAEGLDLPFHSTTTAALLTDKYLQRQALREAGVDASRSLLLGRPDDLEPDGLEAALGTVGLPAIVKPRRGEGSRNTYHIATVNRGAELLSAMLDGPRGSVEHELVVEEYLHGRANGPFGDYVSVESFVADGTITHIAVTGKPPLAPPFRETGHFWPAALATKEVRTIEDLARDALRALGVRVGITHTEIKLTIGGPRIIEVNGRLGGLLNDLSLAAAGLSLIQVAGRLALGQKVPPLVIPADSVSYLYHNPAPTVPCVLESVAGVRTIRSLPGVRSYRTLIRPGSSIPGGVHTNRLDLLSGQASDHVGMLATIDAVLDTLAFTFRRPSGAVTVAARSLHHDWKETTP